jgi:hypothetical protein
MEGFFFPDYPRLFHVPCMKVTDPQDFAFAGVGMCSNIKGGGLKKRRYLCNNCGKEPPHEWVIGLKTLRMGHELNRP